MTNNFINAAPVMTVTHVTHERRDNFLMNFFSFPGDIDDEGNETTHVELEGWSEEDARAGRRLHDNFDDQLGLVFSNMVVERQ